VRCVSQLFVVVSGGALTVERVCACSRGMRGQVYGEGDYFGGDAATSQQYCEGGRQMLIFAVLMDASGVTNEAGPESDGNNGKSILVINKSAHQLPLAKFKFSMKKGGFPRNTRATGSVAFRNPRPSKPRFPHKSRNPRQIPKPASTQAVTIRNPPNIPKPASKPAAQVQGNVSDPYKSTLAHSHPATRQHQTECGLL
jgi:hypothetical protein